VGGEIFSLGSEGGISRSTPERKRPGWEGNNEKNRVRRKGGDPTGKRSNCPEPRIRNSYRSVSKRRLARGGQLNKNWGKKKKNEHRHQGGGRAGRKGGILGGRDRVIDGQKNAKRKN